MKSSKIVSKRVYLLQLWVIFLVSSVVITTVSLYEFKDNISGDLVSGFYGNVLLAALVMSVFYILVMLMIRRIKNTNLQILLGYVWISFMWFFQVLLEFEVRVASWSTYTLSESINVVFLYSFNIILIVSLFYILVLKLIHRYSESR